eukprot:CAMPEP_0201656914 /NCGR_PEP_ID=MMETSP0494-20130426/324_1 /ASSEMBLY_ACC=CAM_ASM_000839 /TAXON_ID=420259 /ORGANISM="Thalassiosira gravida, Strain GMp14c1" /LENGTH=1034 /DNA_ID=CAMNT_0048133637 /DNA_START=421 /DNA_END=3525 /DNA_ORIENTATION=-
MARHSTPVKSQSQSSRGGSSQNTPGSQGGDSVTTEAILSRLGKAKQIESSLEAIAVEQKAAKRGGRNVPPGSDEKSQALRLQLCEVLSDVILKDSQLAHGNDAIGRLWKNCFYGRINDIRSRIVKEKSRAKKRQASGGGEGSGAEAAKKMVGDLDRQLKQFLKEAIQLYRYIIERYLKELMPQSQFSNGSDAEEEEQERSLVIIASLYRMHIHLGDLYRYSSQHKHAEECYLKSAKLAPGTGNPFNQLAVVAQQSQDTMTVVALYYYARSLMATREPFETSRSNLVRLFESNKKWLDEHSRDDDLPSRGIVNAAPTGNMPKRAAQEWRQKERAAANRKALARTVDLQWALFRGVSLDGYAGGRIDLEGLKKKMAGMHDTLSGLIGQASFSEALLCKVMAILAFTTLGASNHGKLITADGFYARRNKDPKWNEGIVMTNQALAFSFLLRVCATLAKDVDAVLSKKEAHKLGVIRSLSPLLLGFRFATSLYDGCDWFHGLPFFPNAGESENDGMESSSIHELCKQSHVEFWESIANMSNRIDTLLTKQRSGQKSYVIEDVKDFAEFHGYIPFASFLDTANDDAPIQDTKTTTKYASTEEVIQALSEKKHSGGAKGVEAETRLKINLVISIADSNTNSDTEVNGGQNFLSKNPETKIREFVTGGTEEAEDHVSDGEYEEETLSDEESMPRDQEPNVTDNSNMDVDKKTGETLEKDATAPPNPVNYGMGMALLTPAALLAGVGNHPPIELPVDVAVVTSKEASKAQNVLPADSILAPMNLEPSNLNTPAAASGVDALLNDAFAIKPQQKPLAKAPLPPPPGFSMPNPPAQRPQLPLPFNDPSTIGISLAEFTAPVPSRQAEQNFTPFGQNQPAPPGMMPQARPSSYPASSMFETMNPFFVQAPPPSFNNNFIAANSSSRLNQSHLLNLPNQGGGVNLQQHTVNKGGLDPTLDFLLNHNNQIQAPYELRGSSNNLNLLIPPSATEHHETEDPSDSIMKFLFEPSNDASSGAGQPLYANRRGHPPSQHHGMPQTNNPFAT